MQEAKKMSLHFTTRARRRLPNQNSMMKKYFAIWLIILTLFHFVRLERPDYTLRSKEIAAAAMPNHVWPSHEYASSQNNERSGNLAFFEAARRHTLKLLHLRGGASGSSHSKVQSCYPLHGEGDTEGREIGSRADPYSVASVSAAPPSAIGEIERIYMEVLRENPKDIAVCISPCVRFIDISEDQPPPNSCILQASES